MFFRKLQEVLPPVLDSTSVEPPALFDGTTSQLTKSHKLMWKCENKAHHSVVYGLQDKIKLVPIDLLDKPTWYKEKVNPENKDPAKREFAEEMISYLDIFNPAIFRGFPADGVSDNVGAVFDHLESAFAKFDDGPFLLGQFSLVDIAYAPFIERFQYYFMELKKYDIKAGRPRLTKWIEELNKIEPYKQTQQDPQILLDTFRRRYLSK
ncbi:hypothetical protein ACLOJK_001593 [Asimina triloba]